MAKDGDSKSKKGKSAQAREETLQIRKKGKNPLIERKVSAPEDNFATAAGLRPIAIDELSEQTDRTEEIFAGLEEIPDAQAQEVPNQRPPSALDDDDETIVALGPPQSPEGLAKQQQQLHKSRQATIRDIQPEPITDEGPLAGFLAPGQVSNEPTGEELDSTPRARMGVLDTGAVGAAAQRAKLEHVESQLPGVRARALKMVRAEMSEADLKSLDAALAGGFDSPSMDGAVSPKQSLEHLVNERSFKELDPQEQSLILEAVAGDPRDVATTKAAIAILKTGVPRHLTADNRSALLRTFVELTSETRALLAQLAARQLRGRSALEDRDIQDDGLIDHLHALTRKNAIASEMENLSIRRDKVLRGLLNAVANPKRLPFEEGRAGVLGMFEFALAECSPAELGRLWHALVTRDMRCDLPGGASLDLGTVIREGEEINFATRDTPLRVALNQLGAAARARPQKTRSTSNFVMPGGHGVDADVISRALGQLYGVGFTVAAGEKASLRHLERVGDDTYRVPPVFVTILYKRGERVFIFDHQDGESVFLRAPHGRSTKRPGASRSDPKREVVDPDLSMDCMPLASFKKSVGVGLIPRT